MLKRLCTLAGVILVSSSFSNIACGVEIDWLERYALSEHREDLLHELIPGTEDYYRFHVLYYQTTGQIDAAQATLEKWKTDPAANNSGHLQSFLDRQMILTFKKQPDQTYDYFQNRLQVDLNHTAGIKPQERRYPDVVDIAPLELEQVIKRAIASQSTLGPQALRFIADQILASADHTYEGVGSQWILERLGDAPYKQIAKLVTLELEQRSEATRVFGNYKAHQQLTLDELLELRKAVPEVANSENLVDEILQRLQPPSNVDLRKQKGELKSYYERLYAFARDLPSGFNSLKAHVLYRLLELNLTLDVYDQDLFVAYLELPRNSAIIKPQLRNVPEPPADMSRDFSDLIRSAPVQDEQPLVRVYLEYFFQNAEGIQPFDNYLQPDYLKGVFAETKILYGAPAAEKYFAMLTPVQKRELKERIELQLTQRNTEFSDPSQPQTLSIDIKGVSKLLVRTYRINTAAFYRFHSEILNSDVDLDGLIPSRETSYEYQQPSQIRHRENLTLPEIEGRGVWVVDLLAGGLRCRAVIRRGDLYAVTNQQDNGYLFTILNEKHERVPGAKVKLGSREFDTDNEGRVSIPYMERTQQELAVLSDGVLASPFQFELPGETFELQSNMLLPRETIQSGRSTRVIIRPQLRIADQVVSLARVESASVKITSSDINGVQTSRQFSDLQLTDDADLSVEFRIPENCRQIQIELQTIVLKKSTNTRETLSSNHSWPVGTFADTREPADIFLTRTNDRWFVEVLGRNGEALAGAPVQLNFNTELSSDTFNAVAQTNDKGLISISVVPHITTITAVLNSNLSRSWSIDSGITALPIELSWTSEKEIRIPISGNSIETSTTNRFQLFEFKSGRPVKELSQELKIEDGFVHTGKLASGSYRLFDHASQSSCLIHVSDAKIVDGYTVGQPWLLPVERVEPFSISGVATVNDKLKIAVANASKFTRVHVLASRYVPDQSMLEQLILPRNHRERRNRLTPPNLYLSGMKLGDEYQYVLRRQSAKKFPGVILPQPSLLLNPWVIDSADNTVLNAALGDAPASMPIDPESASIAKENAAQKSHDSQSKLSSYDFLAQPGVLFSNLELTNGQIEIDLEQLENHTIITVVAADPEQASMRQVYRNQADVQTKESRLAASFRSDLNLTQDRSVRIVDKEHPLKLADIGLAQFQIYRTISEIMPVLGNLHGDGRWSEFSKLGQWHTLSFENKQKVYAQLACHELHLFLFVKDKPFFDTVIHPYLANKKEKQVIDDFLLGADLTKYLVPWRYLQMNAIEKALLAHALPQERRSVVRELQEIVETRKDDPADTSRQVEFALAGKQLEERLDDLMLMESDFAQDGTNTWSAPAFAADASAGTGYGGQADEKSLGTRRLQMNSRGAGRFDKKDAENFYRFGLNSNGPVELGQMFYQHLEQTKQWAESQWDRHRGIEQSVGLATANQFWRDLAAAESLEHFTSEHILEATDSRHAALVAIAFMDLPMTSDFEIPADKNAVIAPEQPLVLVSRQTKSLTESASNKNIMIGQHISRENLPSNETAEEGETEEPSKNEFLTGVVYDAKLTVTNLSSKPQRVNVLWQIPGGAIALPNTDGKLYNATDSTSLEVAAFSTSTIAYAFYFPSAGDFAQYPACVSKNDVSLARAEAVSFHVVNAATQFDESSWEFIAERGDAEQIRNYLSDSNLRKLDLSRVYHRCQDPEIYRVVLDVLKINHVFDQTLFGYSIKHRDATTFAQFLSSQLGLIRSLGPNLQSDLVEIDAVDRHFIEHLEFAPLVVPRIHPLRDKLEFTNAKLQGQYESLLTSIAYRPTRHSSDDLAVVYYQLANNRIDESLTRFRKIDREQTTMTLQFDYLDAYLALHQLDADRAFEIASRYQEFPILRWQERFREIVAQVQDYRNLQGSSQIATIKGIDQHSGDLALIDRERRQQAASATQPSLSMRLQGDQLLVDFANTTQATIRVYPVDLELLFSKNPFVRDGLERMAIAEPNSADTVRFEGTDGTTTLKIPANFKNRTVLVELESGTARATALYYGGQMATYVSDSFGQLQVIHSQTRQPIAGAYVKVYARHNTGEVRFYKDGYTDLRGRFDYTSISNSDLATAERLAILVLDQENGATLHDVAPPK